MIHAYSELYLNDAMTNTAELLIMFQMQNH